MVMFSRLTNALTAFMDLMNRVFKNLLSTPVIIFTVDILIYSKTETKHESQFIMLLTRLKPAFIRQVF